MTVPFSPAAALRFQRGAEYLHACGPRATAEFLAALDDAHGIAPAMLDMLDTWRRTMPAETLHAVLATFAGGYDFPPAMTLLP